MMDHHPNKELLAAQEPGPQPGNVVIPMNRHELAKHLNKHPDTISRYVRERGLPCAYIGRSSIFNWVVVGPWLMANGLMTERDLHIQPKWNGHRTRNGNPPPAAPTTRPMGIPASPGAAATAQRPNRKAAQ